MPEKCVKGFPDCQGRLDAYAKVQQILVDCSIWGDSTQQAISADVGFFEAYVHAKLEEHLAHIQAKQSKFCDAVLTDCEQDGAVFTDGEQDGTVFADGEQGEDMIQFLLQAYPDCNSAAL